MNIDQEIEEYKRKIEELEKKKNLLKGRKISPEQAKVIEKSISQKIKHMRKISGLKQDEIAELFGVSRTTISNIERHYHLPTIPTLLNLIAAIGCKISDVLPDDLLDFSNPTE